MNILVIETATEACSAALKSDNQMLKTSKLAPQQHSQLILPMVEELLIKADIDVSDLDYLAFGRGPGSFTGVRIATGMVQGLAMSCNIPVLAISTLGTMAQNAAAQLGAKYVAAAIDARMGEVYFGIYQKDSDGVMQLTDKEQVMPPEQAEEKLTAFITEHNAEVHTVGTGWKAYPQMLENDPLMQSRVKTSEILYPDAEYMLPIAEAMVKNNQAVGVADVQPLYVRDEVTWKKLPGRE